MNFSTPPPPMLQCIHFIMVSGEMCCKVLFYYSYKYMYNRGTVKTTATPTGGSRGPRTYVFNAQNANFSLIFLRSRLILSMILIEIWPKTRKNNDFYFNLQHFQ